MQKHRYVSATSAVRWPLLALMPLIVATSTRAAAESNLALLVSLDGAQTLLDPAAYGSVVANDDGSTVFAGSVQGDGGSMLSWQIVVKGDVPPAEGVAMLLPPSPAVLSVNYLLINSSTVLTQNFSVAVALPAGPGTIPAVAGASITGVASDLNGDGVTAAAPSGGAIGNFLIDSVLAQSLLTDPYAATGPASGFGIIGPASFGDPIPSMPVAPPLTDIGCQIDLVLTPADATAVSAQFVVAW